jgi:hypothetical protein
MGVIWSGQKETGSRPTVKSMKLGISMMRIAILLRVWSSSRGAGTLPRHNSAVLQVHENVKLSGDSYVMAPYAATVFPLASMVVSVARAPCV